MTSPTGTGRKRKIGEEEGNGLIRSSLVVWRIRTKLPPTPQRRGGAVCGGISTLADFKRIFIFPADPYPSRTVPGPAWLPKTVFMINCAYENQSYSFFNSIAGFVFAALSTCQITEAKAMIPERSTASTKFHQYPSNLYMKSFRYSCAA